MTDPDLTRVIAADDLDEAAWGLLANVMDWTDQSPEWQDAVVRWRTAYHEKLARRYPVTPRPWRLGRHYPIHVYDGDTPIATFFTAADAARCVADHNRGG